MIVQGRMVGCTATALILVKARSTCDSLEVLACHRRHVREAAHVRGRLHARTWPDAEGNSALSTYLPYGRAAEHWPNNIFFCCEKTLSTVCTVPGHVNMGRG